MEKKTWTQIAVEHAQRMQSVAQESQGRHVSRADQMKNHPAGKRR